MPSSVPSSFKNYDDDLLALPAPQNTVTFAIPAVGGPWTSALWTVNHTQSGSIPGLDAYHRIGVGADTADISPTHTTDGTYTDSGFATPAQVIAINAAVGTSINVVINLIRGAVTLALRDTINSFTLTLISGGGGGTDPPGVGGGTGGGLPPSLTLGRIGVPSVGVASDKFLYLESIESTLFCESLGPTLAADTQEGTLVADSWDDI